MADTDLGVIVERISNLKSYIEEKVVDVKKDIGEVAELQRVANGRTKKLEDNAIEDAIYKGKVQIILYLFGALLSFLFLGILAPVAVIYIQSKFHI